MQGESDRATLTPTDELNQAVMEMHDDDAGDVEVTMAESLLSRGTVVEARWVPSGKCLKNGACLSERACVGNL